MPSVLGQHHSLGFDKNDYPGDNLLPALHRSFSYTGYWLNNPPGANSNNWTGKRDVLKANGFGFMILFNGRLDKELRGKDAAALGRRDAAAAVAAAKREGFAPARPCFLIRRKVEDCYPNKALISLHGSMRCADRITSRVYIAAASR